MLKSVMLESVSNRRLNRFQAGTAVLGGMAAADAADAFAMGSDEEDLLVAAMGPQGNGAGVSLTNEEQLQAAEKRITDLSKREARRRTLLDKQQKRVDALLAKRKQKTGRPTKAAKEALDKAQHELSRLKTNVLPGEPDVLPKPTQDELLAAASQHAGNRNGTAPRPRG